MGMKREAVQEERQRKERGEGEVESSSSVNNDMPVEKIFEAETTQETSQTQFNQDAGQVEHTINFYTLCILKLYLQMSYKKYWLSFNTCQNLQRVNQYMVWNESRDPSSVVFIHKGIV